MLVLTRQRDESIFCILPDGSEIQVMLIDVRGEKVRLGFTADKTVTIHRKEVLDAIRRENRAAAQVPTAAETREATEAALRKA